MAPTNFFDRLDFEYTSERDRIFAHKLDHKPTFGTYGMIEISLIWYYPSIPGKIYHPISNPSEASWWLNYYKNNEEVKDAKFIPSVEQISTGDFSPPEIPEEQAGEEKEKEFWEVIGSYTH